jgi:hypothetical protein
MALHMQGKFGKGLPVAPVISEAWGGGVYQAPRGIRERRLGCVIVTVIVMLSFRVAMN